MQSVANRVRRPSRTSAHPQVRIHPNWTLSGKKAFDPRWTELEWYVGYFASFEEVVNEPFWSDGFGQKDQALLHERMQSMDLSALRREVLRTEPWFRAEILHHIRTVRSALLSRGRLKNPEAFVVMAIHLGMLMKDAEWRLGLGAAALTGIKTRAANKNNASRVRTRNERNDQIVFDYFDDKRRRKPTVSRAQLIREVVKELKAFGLNENTLKSKLQRRERERRARLNSGE